MTIHWGGTTEKNIRLTQHVVLWLQIRPTQNSLNTMICFMPMDPAMLRVRGTVDKIIEFSKMYAENSIKEFLTLT